MSPRPSADLIPRALRDEVEAVCPRFNLDRIEQVFAAEGFDWPDGFVPEDGRQRRSLVEEFHRLIDFTERGAATAYLGVVERVLEELDRSAEMEHWAWAYEGAERIRRELDRFDFRRDARGRLRLPARLSPSAALLAAPTESGIRLAMTQLERDGGEPEERVGAAKELVEATIKFALDATGETYKATADVPELAKQLHRRLRLDPSAVAPTAAGADTLVRVLSGLSQIPHGLAELRNQGYGTGHGRAARISGIKARHADLA